MSIASPFRVVVRVLAALLVIVFFLFALAILATRYVVLPHIDDYRSYIEAAAMRAVGAQVRLGDIEASWTGLHPRLRVQNARILNAAGEDALLLPEADAVIGWRSLLTLQPELLYLKVSAPHVQVRRDAAGRVWMAGIRLSASAVQKPRDVDDAPLLRWVLRQRFIEVQDALISWVDETGVFPPLRAEGVDFLIEHPLLGQTRFAIDVPHASNYLGSLKIRGQMRRGLDLPGRPNDGLDGRVYIEAQEVDLATLPTRRFQVFGELQGQVAARVWFNFRSNRPTRWNGDLEAHALLHTGSAIVPPFNAEEFKASLQGDLREGRASGSVNARNGSVVLERFFEAAEIPVQVLQVHGEIQGLAGSGLELTAHQLLLDAGEPGARASASGSGTWRQTEDLRWGQLDAHGTIDYGDAGAVSRFMPLVVDADVREWLRDGLRNGVVTQGTWEVRGPLDEFPFDEVDESVGMFQIGGQVRDLDIDLVPDVKPGWPELQGLAGRVQINRASLTAVVEAGHIRLPTEHALTTAGAHVHIPNMRIDPVLSVETEFSGQAQGFLDYIRASPVNEYTRQVLANAAATGEWRVPLKVVAPLARLDDLKLQGDVVLQGGNIQFEPQTPELSRVEGVVHFTEAGATAENVRARLLGGPVTLSGRTHDAGGGELSFHGMTAAEQWSQVYKVPGMRRFAGSADYQGRLLVPANGGETRLELESTLEGLVVTMPPPMAKPANVSWPLRLEFRDPGRGKDKAGSMLNINIDPVLSARVAFHPRASKHAPTSIERATIGLGTSVAALPSKGLQVNVRAAAFDMDAWHAVLDEFVLPSQSGGTREISTSGASTPSARGERRFLPADVQGVFDVDQLALLGGRIHEAQLQVAGNLERELRISVKAEEVTGNVVWQPAEQQDGRNEQVTAHLSRLVIPRPAEGNDGPERGQDAPGDVPQSMPDVHMTIDDFRYGTWDLGQVQVEARNAASGHAWQLQRLVVANSAATLRAHGDWSLASPAQHERLMHLEVDWQIHNAGELLERFGFTEVVAGGSGALKGRVDWQGKPFVYDVRTLNGQLALNLENGRFLKVDSQAGRLLGILSLQTLARTAAFASGSLFASGFAWDSLRAEADINKGIADIEHFEMQGQGALAVLSGRVDIINETQHLKAIVVPKIDASAAALLAGLAINPAVGLGALLTQWLLREPLAQAFTYEYNISGGWDAPQVTRVREPHQHTPGEGREGAAGGPTRSEMGEMPNY